MTSESLESPPDSPRLRSGTAARLAGLPVTTLRVWERRYGVVAAQRTAAGQRVYSPHDVSRLRLLRGLTRSGHAIGTIATLDLDVLRSLADDARTMTAPSTDAPAEAVVVGRGLAAAIESVSGCTVRDLYDDLDQAAAAPRGRPAALLLVRLASLQAGTVDRVLALSAALCAEAVFVVYAFGTDASADALREAGMAVRREPLAGRDVSRWVRGARAARAAAPPAASSAWRIEPRAFDDPALARLIETPSPVACECLRHMAEIVAQLAAFERYSLECTSTGPADAELHRHLARTAGASRTLFEQALRQVVVDAGLALDDRPRQ